MLRSKYKQNNYRCRPRVERLERRELLAAVITVNSTLDSNTRDLALTLREAMLINNRSLSLASLTAAELLQVVGLPSNSDSDTIRFNIPATAAGHVYYKNDAVAGQVSPANVTVTTAIDDALIGDIDPDWAHSWYSIAPTSPLPLLNDPATIDGLSQPGANANTNAVGEGLNSVLKVEVTGQNAGQVEFGLIGIPSSGGGSTVRGLALNRATGPKIMFESGAANNRVEGNFIGPDVSGTVVFAAPVVPLPLPGFLRSNGVFAWTGGNTIGGLTADKRNLISGNVFQTTSLDAGIALRGFGAPSLVQGNLIGTDRTGAKALGNVGYGVLVDSPNNIIGGIGEGAGNVISANQNGIYAESGNNTGGTIVGNWIGTDVTGTHDLGNAGHGILFGNSGEGNRVEVNVIAFNGRSGVKVGTANQLLTQNSIFSNDELGIAGAKHFPTISSVSAIGGSLRISGAQSGAAGDVIRLEFFANPERDEHVPTGTFTTPGTLGEGKTILGDLVVTIPASGTFNFSVDYAVDLLGLPGAGAQPFVTATATDITDPGSGPRNKTSEFSPVAVLGGPNYIVTSTADTGLGTLREAIINANLTAGPQTITFAISANDPRHFYYRDDGVAGNVSLGNIVSTTAATDAAIPTNGPEAIDPDWPHSWFSVLPSRDLPAIIDSVMIDGYSQAGATANTLPALGPIDAVLKIELNGTNAPADGLQLTFGGQVGVNFTDAANSTIKGLTINRFGGDGVELNTLDGMIVLAGNFIGTDVSGTVDLGNDENGIRLINEQDIFIGTEDAATRNLVSGNDANGIEHSMSGSLSVIGFLIGWDRTMTRSLINAQHGITTELGDDTALSILESSGSCAERVHERIKYVSGAIKTGNVAAAIRHALVDSLDPCKAEITQSVLSRTEDLGQLRALDASAAVASSPVIDLGGDGVSVNDGDNPNTPLIDPDSDGGPNGLQNFPLLSSATRTTGAVITGSLTSHVQTRFRVEFFSSALLDAAGYGLGESYLGSVNVATNSLGVASFTFTAPTPVPVGNFITATATLLVDDDNNSATPLVGAETSEYSAGIAVRENPWHNKAKPLDVSGNGGTTARDALDVINFINAFGVQPVPSDAVLGVPAYYDTSNDARVTANDALRIINHINAFGNDPAGESGAAEGEPLASMDLLTLLALELVNQPQSRKVRTGG